MKRKHPSPAPLMIFTVADAHQILGRRPTEMERRAIVKGLEFSDIGEIFTDIVRVSRGVTA